MKILYCNITEMAEYNGIIGDTYHGGGSYTKDNIPLEVNNFTLHDDKYYGFVQSTNDTIDISSHFGASKNENFIDGVLVVWICKGDKIVGFYKDATVFRKKQNIPSHIVSQRVSTKNAGYNITTNQAILIPVEKRTCVLTRKIGRCNIWYGDEENNEIVKKFLVQYETSVLSNINKIEDISEGLKGQEIECIIKQRVNQDIFREQLLKRFCVKCAICGLSNKEFLIASHIKPWSKSDCNEKLSKYNGLLLCPNHDKLFDKGYISFTDKGEIIISSQLNEFDRIFLNITNDMKINSDLINDEMKIYLKFHRTMLFKN